MFLTVWALGNGLFLSFTLNYNLTFEKASGKKSWFQINKYIIHDEIILNQPIKYNASSQTE